MSSRSARLAALALLVGALALAGFLIAQLVGAGEGGTPTRGPLLATNRSILSVCLEGVGYEASQNDVDWLSEALNSALTSFPDTPAEFGRRETVLDCPSPPRALMDESVRLIDYPVSEGVRVEQAGPHRLFVYVLPAEIFSRRSTLPYVVGNGEYILEGDVGRPVSAALYLPSGIAPETLREALLSALGLQQPVSPRSTEEWQRGVCELGTPAPRCAEFED